MKQLILIFSIAAVLIHAEKLEISADKFVAKDAEKVVRFLGHAQISQGATHVSAEKIELFFNDDNTTKQYSATGNVQFHIKKSTTNYKGHCETMHYYPDAQKYVLLGNVRVKDRANHREIDASKIVIHSKTGAFVIQGSKKRTAKLTFEIK